MKMFQQTISEPSKETFKIDDTIHCHDIIDVTCCMKNFIVMT